jgi:hypothetical protein
MADDASVFFDGERADREQISTMKADGLAARLRKQVTLHDARPNDLRGSEAISTLLFA